MTTITLDYPPSANRYWRHDRGVTHRSTQADAYIAGVVWTCKLAGLEPVTDDVRLSVRVYRPRRAGDLDNTLKVLIDAMRGWAYEDDGQIAEIHAVRFEDKARPRVEVEITTIEREAQR